MKSTTTASKTKSKFAFQAVKKQGIQIFEGAELDSNKYPKGELKEANLHNDEIIIPATTILYVKSDLTDQEKKELYMEGKIDEKFFVEYQSENGVPIELRYIAKSRSLVKEWQEKNKVEPDDEDNIGIVLHDTISEIDSAMMAKNRFDFIRFSSFNGSNRFRNPNAPLAYYLLEPEAIEEKRKEKVGFKLNKLQDIMAILDSTEKITLCKEIYEANGESFSNDPILWKDEILNLLESGYEEYKGMYQAKLNEITNKVLVGISNNDLYIFTEKETTSLKSHKDKEINVLFLKSGKTEEDAIQIAETIMLDNITYKKF